MKRTFAIINTIALAITIVINYLSNTGLINGNTMKTISDRYQNYFTPAGYAFSIWGVIYLGLAGFIFFNWSTIKERSNEVVTKIGWWFVISCVANSAWVFAWLNDELVVSVFLMITLLVSLLVINMSITKGRRERFDNKTLLMVKWPFNIYFGWVSVALIANVAALLTKLSWDGWGIPGITWTIIMIIVAGIVNVAVLLTKKLHPFALVGIWALVAIAASNKTGVAANNVVYACYGVSAVLLIFIIASVLKSGLTKS
ncbi:hypothetical protein [Mucilaginibacter auburnensis]|uniref:TspO/MBR related protein n=1 Tax=Mucilaginibacter auburnensis TaxID=1457233 RepID=A0A2H9VM28_9SPHI|nr:hypothetical protein [Mucilaginibacter auburnensis]PJJ79376.1 hypothetical protein CLV57_2510 [Mucilaginibacter auburnensis]